MRRLDEIYNAKYKMYLENFQVEFEKYLNGIKTSPEILGDSMRYSALLGGKRIRPVLMLATGDALGVDLRDLLPYAVSLELIHTYSLIHDDLPEMDNDDFRRGNPSNHKVYGTANALLAGDGLLNTAYSILFEQCFRGNNFVSAAKSICDAAGIYGMIAGQSADILHQNDDKLNEAALEYIYTNKTGQLIVAAVTVPAVLNGGKFYAEMYSFGQKLGYLFQLTDDILDVTGSFENMGKTLGKDEQEDKLTAIKIFGLQNCLFKTEIISKECHKILDVINADTVFLHQIVDFVKSRVN